MKKIANKILLITTLPILLTISVFSMISFRFTRSRIKELTDHLIYESASSWKHQFEAYFNNKEVAIDICKKYIEQNFTLEDLKDPVKLNDQFQDFYKIGQSLILGLRYLNIYVWFDPDYTSAELMEFSIRDLNQTGDIIVVDDYTYTHQEMEDNPDSWSWFLIPLEQGVYITDPYDWEGYSQKLVSFTKSVDIDGKAVGVIGSDMYIEELQNNLLAESFLDKGYYALLNNKLEFLAHPEGYLGESFFSVFSENEVENTETLTDVSISDGIIESGNQVIGFSRLKNGWVILAVPDMSELYHSLNRLSFIYLIILSVILVIIIGFSLIVSKNISSPIEQATAMLKDIASGEGDLTQRINLKTRSNDETANLARYFNDFIQDLNKMVRNLKEISLSNRQMSDVLASNTTEISASSTQMSAITKSISDRVRLLTAKIETSADNVNDIKQQIQTVNNSIDNESAFINESSAAITEMVSSINNLTRISIEKQDVIRELTNHAKVSNEAMEETARDIIEISNSVSTILELVRVINDVSDRINLLSMNAAIEAAHAGDAGKGFAVVADEIRKLAETTNEQSSNISRSVQSIAEKIAKSGKSSKNSEEASQKINMNILQISDAINELVQGMTEISEGSKQIVDSLEELVRSSQTVRESAIQVNGKSDIVLNDMKEINEISHQNFSGIQEMVAGNNEISKAIEKLAEMGNENLQNSNAMDEKLDQFKV